MATFNYKEQHAVIVKCGNESEQQQTFIRLKELGYNDLKIVSV